MLLPSSTIRTYVEPIFADIALERIGIFPGKLRRAAHARMGSAPLAAGKGVCDEAIPEKRLHYSHNNVAPPPGRENRPPQRCGTWVRGSQNSDTRLVDGAVRGSERWLPALLLGWRITRRRASTRACPSMRHEPPHAGSRTSRPA